VKWEWERHHSHFVVSGRNRERLLRLERDRMHLPRQPIPLKAPEDAHEDDGER